MTSEAKAKTHFRIECGRGRAHFAAPSMVETYFFTACRNASRSRASSVHERCCGSCVLSCRISPTCSGVISQTQGRTGRAHHPECICPGTTPLPSYCVVARAAGDRMGQRQAPATWRPASLHAPRRGCSPGSLPVFAPRIHTVSVPQWIATVWIVSCHQALRVADSARGRLEHTTRRLRASGLQMHRDLQRVYRREA